LLTPKAASSSKIDLAATPVQGQPKPAKKQSGPVFDRFDAWVEAYAAAESLQQCNLLEIKGVELAMERRDNLEDLIQTNPEEALRQRVSYATRMLLPQSIQTYLEEPVQGRGNLMVLAALPSKSGDTSFRSVFRQAELGESVYDAYVYGRRLGEVSRTHVFIHGIAIGKLMAVAESPVRQVEPAEIGDNSGNIPPNVCAFCGMPAAYEGEASVLESGNGYELLCSEDHAQQYTAQALATEIALTSAGSGLSTLSTPSWTTGMKNAIMIRVDFTDLPGVPFSDQTGTNTITGVNSFYQANSYGLAGFRPIGEGSALTETFRMPQTAAYYGTNNYYDKLRRDARTSATAAGYALSQYNFDLICFGNTPGWTWAGLGYVGVAGVWLHGSFDTGVAAHELGHNLGLNHANFWDAGQDSAIGPGTNIEYGDKFDTMGSASAGQKHFNARYKNLLGWLPSSDVISFTTNGVYTLHPHDLTNAAGPRALRVSRNASTNYWIEFRQIYTGNKWLMNGVGLRWAQSGYQATLLLDTTPGSFDGKDDSAIVPGRTFSDPVAGIHITTLGLGGTTPESVQVAVNKGAFPENHAPILKIAASATSAAAGTIVLFSAQAADADGDALAYAWDFGDRNFGTNDAAAAHSWQSSGRYLVRCIVSDMKGGTASESIVIRVGSPSTWVVSGRVLDNGQPVPDARIYVSSSQSVLSDSDGTFKLPGLSAGSYALNARKEGLSFVHPGFANPISLKADMSNMVFLAVSAGTEHVETLLAAGSMWRYLDDGSDQGAHWTSADFDDRSWKEGAARLGYGDADVNTTVSYGTNSSKKYITTYFRSSLAIEGLKKYSSFTASIVRDDGAVVWLNGKEVFRSNMPATPVDYTTKASATVSGTDELAFFDYDIPPSAFVEGTNVFAVEIHQINATSSDLGFDFKLTATALVLESPPSLSWSRRGGMLQIEWPASSGYWLLYSSPDFSSTALLPSDPGRIFTSNGMNSVLISPTNGQEFFFLRAY
jgi:PKD repeat protein